MSDYQNRQDNSYLYAGNAPYIEALYEEFLDDEASVPEHWRDYFRSIQPSNGAPRDVRHSDIRQDFRDSAKTRGNGSQPSSAQTIDPSFAEKQACVLRLIQAYRQMGHLRSSIDMIDLRKKADVPELDIEYCGLGEQDMDTLFNTGTLIGPKQATLRNILHILQATYTGTIGVEYLHIHDHEQQAWIEHKLESSLARPNFSTEKKKRILERLTAADGLERYLQTKYAGQKRFSLEGGDSFVPFLDALILEANRHEVYEVAFAMAHRGRLNVLVNTMGKLPHDLFLDFEGKNEKALAKLQGGDVKYHQGFSSDIDLEHGPMHLSLSFNPSHLEVIDPVVQGSVRARQKRVNDKSRSKIIAVSVHGDAAISGQGVVYETFNMAQTRGFSTGGTVHVVINNRIGFTTSHPLDMRSTLYCTDIGKVCGAPIFHVNGDDPEAVVFVAELALEFRMRFHREVIIDLICYRTHGHNEADEPAATQPIMYEKIRNHLPVRQIYANRLVEEDVLTEPEAEQMVLDYRQALDDGKNVSSYPVSDLKYPYIADWKHFLDKKWTDPANTAIPIADLKLLGEKVTSFPETFVLHPRVEKIIDDRRKMTAGALPIDWGCAETLAYATLLKEGYPVRISGQDSGRGTFFHRHAVLHDQRTGETFMPLQHLDEEQSDFDVIDSVLSELAVVGFEYGYASTDPQTLVIWEAQFGDFVNGAQILIDQFISSCEEKWGRLCGLVMMLPHGWEGQGPEHSSARLERFMQLCARENIQVCTPTTPAQMFHLLRRQMVRTYRKPLIIMSPKSMLRRKLSFSSLDDFADRDFQTLIPEVDEVEREEVRRVVICGGKVYYDVLEGARAGARQKIAVVRIEQLYPFPKDLLAQQLKFYTNAKEVVWCQEEPMNQGAWYHIVHNIRACMRRDQSLSYAGRLLSAAPSGGSHSRHVERQKRLVAASVNIEWTAPHPIVAFEPRNKFDWK